MLNYPIVLPRLTQYAALGLDPEATPADLNEAKNRLIAELNEERGELERKLAKIFEAVPGLQEAREAVNPRGQTSGPGPTDGSARTRLTHLESRAELLNPEYRSICARADEIATRITELNLMQVVSTKAEGRRDYDRRNPPLELFKLAPCSPDSLGQCQGALRLLRIGLSSFLEDGGTTVFHPSDLTRREFSRDFEWTAILDGDG